MKFIRDNFIRKVGGGVDTSRTDNFFFMFFSIIIGASFMLFFLTWVLRYMMGSVLVFSADNISTLIYSYTVLKGASIANYRYKQHQDTKRSSFKSSTGSTSHNF